MFAARLARDRWFCWEQPDRDRFAIAALGSVGEAVSRGPERFSEVAATCAELVRGRVADEPEELPAGAGPGMDRRLRVRARRRLGPALVVAAAGADGPSGAVAVALAAIARC